MLGTVIAMLVVFGVLAPLIVYLTRDWSIWDRLVPKIRTTSQESDKWRAHYIEIYKAGMAKEKELEEQVTQHEEEAWCFTRNG